MNAPLFLVKKKKKAVLTSYSDNSDTILTTLIISFQMATSLCADVLQKQKFEINQLKNKKT